MPSSSRRRAFRRNEQVHEQDINETRASIELLSHLSDQHSELSRFLLPDDIDEESARPRSLGSVRAW